MSRVVEDLKDESEPYRRMVMETIDKVVTNLGAADIDARLEELLIDGILYAFQEQVSAMVMVVVVLLVFIISTHIRATGCMSAPICYVLTLDQP